MKSKIALALISAATILGVTASAVQAGPYRWGGGINERQERQARRIERGIDRGQLTRREARKLRREQRDIAELERCLREVGGRGLQPMERRILQRLLDLASENIRELKQNDKRRWTWHRGGRVRHYH